MQLDRAAQGGGAVAVSGGVQETDACDTEGCELTR